MVTHYQPMAPTLVRAPFHRDGWVYEEKASQLITEGYPPVLVNS